MQEYIILDETQVSHEIQNTATLEGSIYTIPQIAFATFFGSPLVGAYMLARNCKTLFGQKQSVFDISALGITLFLLPFAVLFLEVDNLIFMIPLLGSLAMSVYTYTRLDEDIEYFLALGGKAQKSLHVTGLTVASFLVSFMINIFLLILIDSATADVYSR